MNPSATMPLTQMLLSWTLLGVLFAWMLFCAFLALRPLKAEKRHMADLSTPSGAFPLLVPHTPLHRLSASSEISVESIPSASAESASDVSAAPVA
ncbi:MAG: hypothetical protein ACRDHW_22300, partial [Ktedonobacteraceae bacterium]